MQKIKVKELMVPVSEYPTVSRDASLYQAILALEEGHRQLKERTFKPRAVLVVDQEGQVVGKLSMWNIMRALEPKYADIADFDRLGHWGLNPEFLRSIVKDRRLWADPLEHLCQTAANKEVHEFMSLPQADEIVDEDDNLAEAIHHLVMGKYLSLLVKKQGRVTGFLRLCDVFEKVAELVKSCQI